MRLLDYKNAPIVIFVYRRLEHVQKTIEAIVGNLGFDSSKVFVFSDGARGGDEQEVRKVRSYLRGIKKNNVIVVEREKNIGLAANITSGVSEIIDIYGKVIVLEDDIVTSPGFLVYMNAALNKYEKNREVMCISGHSQLKTNNNVIPETFFLRGRGECWGWATWKRAWDKFRKEPAECFRNVKIKDLFRFDSIVKGGLSQIAFNYLGKMNTWAVFWDFSVFENNGLCLCVKESLVQNIGFDGTGEDCGNESYNGLITGEIDPQLLPNEIEENYDVAKAYYNEIKKQGPDRLRRFARQLYSLNYYLQCKKKLRKDQMTAI